MTYVQELRLVCLFAVIFAGLKEPDGFLGILLAHLLIWGIWGLMYLLHTGNPLTGETRKDDGTA